MKQKVVILGASGSIGESTLDVVGRHPERFEVFAVSAWRRIERLATVIRRHQPRYAVVADSALAEQLRHLLNGSAPQTQICHGERALCEIAAHSDADTVVAAIVGIAGLLPAMAAVRAGKRILLANKEALVSSGEIFMQAVARYGATLLPVDSEHNAIFQCLPEHYRRCPQESGVEKILLTASGGPFRDASAQMLAEVTPEQACVHPKWDMGRKISVDSATLMNKGLEVIEACWLFGVPTARIEVVVHPQSIIHSLVAYRDGSVLAQMGNPDMRTPIAQALAWPDRIDAAVAALNLFEIATLTFEPPDTQRFPCLRLAYQALRQGGGFPAMLNAANEVAVAAFLERRLRFVHIPAVIDGVLSCAQDIAPENLDAVFQADHAARVMADELVKKYSVT